MINFVLGRSMPASSPPLRLVTSQRCQLTEGRFAVPAAKRLMPVLIPPLVAHPVIAPQPLASIGRQLSADGPVHQ